MIRSGVDVWLPIASSSQEGQLWLQSQLQCGRSLPHSLKAMRTHQCISCVEDALSYLSISACFTGMNRHLTWSLRSQGYLHLLIKETEVQLLNGRSWKATPY